MSNLIFYVLGFISASFIVGALLVVYGMAQELDKERKKRDL